MHDQAIGIGDYYADADGVNRYGFRVLLHNLVGELVGIEVGETARFLKVVGKGPGELREAHARDDQISLL